MNRFQRLWRYEKLANENVKDEKVIDDGDYNSCFQLRKNLKNSCKKLIIMKSQQQQFDESKVKEVTVEDAASVATEKKIIKKLREQQNNKQNKENRNQKSLYKCLNKFLNKVSTQHERLHDENEGEEKSKSHDEYVASGIYEIFGQSCKESLTNTKKLSTRQNEIEAEDLSSNSWYQSGLLGKFSLEMLKHQSPGSFIIHKSSCKSSNFILSLRVPSKSSSKVNHYLILQSKKGYQIKGEVKFFPTIVSLVTHHSVMSEQLPVALMVQRETNNLVYKSNNDDYSSLEDLNIIFTDLE